VESYLATEPFADQGTDSSANIMAYRCPLEASFSGAHLRAHCATHQDPVIAAYQRTFARADAKPYPPTFSSADSVQPSFHHPVAAAYSCPNSYSHALAHFGTYASADFYPNNHPYP